MEKNGHGSPIRLRLLDQVIEVCVDREEILEELGAVYPAREPSADRTDARLRCAPDSGRCRLEIEPSASLVDLFPLELGERFERLPGEVRDRLSQIGFRQENGTLLAHGPLLRTLDVALLHLSLLSARRRGRDPILFHGAAFAPPAPQGGVLMLFGVSGAGKSTLAATLSREGMACLSDEIVGIEEDQVLAYPRAIGLRERPQETSREYVSARGERKYLVDPRTLGSPAAPARARARTIVLLEPYGPHVEALKLQAADAAIGLLPHVYTGRDAPAVLLLKLITFCSTLECWKVRPGSPVETTTRLRSLG